MRQKVEFCNSTLEEEIPLSFKAVNRPGNPYLTMLASRKKGLSYPMARVKRLTHLPSGVEIHRLNGSLMLGVETIRFSSSSLWGFHEEIVQRNNDCT